MHICVHKILIFTNYVDFDKFLLTSRSRRRRLYSVYESLSWDARVLLSSPSLSVLSDKWPRHVSFSSCVPSSPLWRCRFLSSLYLVTLASLPWSGVEWEPRLSSLLKFSCTLLSSSNNPFHLCLASLLCLLELRRLFPLLLDPRSGMRTGVVQLRPVHFEKVRVRRRTPS